MIMTEPIVSHKRIVINDTFRDMTDWWYLYNRDSRLDVVYYFDIELFKLRGYEI